MQVHRYAALQEHHCSGMNKSMSRSSLTLLIMLIAFLCLVAVPVGAVIQEVTVKGVVATVNQPGNTLTINNPAQYGCTYPSSGAPTCTWTPYYVSALTGTVPDASAFSLFKAGDPIIGTNTGGAGDTWITLAKLYGSRPNEEFITDVIGEPETIPVPLIGSYILDLTTSPDCARCSGATCTANSSHVTVLSSGRVVAEKILLPGEMLSYNGRNDGSMISVAFVRGQALSSVCEQAQPGAIGGIQPVSDFIVKVVPPVSYNQNNIRTATTTRLDEGLPVTAVTTPIVTPETPTPVVTSIPAPTKSGSQPFIATGALGLIVLGFAMKKR